MAFIVNKTDGTVLVVLPDGTKNTSTSMTLFGKSTLEYGEELNENFIRLLENSASTVSPTNPLVGQLWFDTSETLLKVFNGNDYRPIGGAISSTNPPNNNVSGTLWWNSDELKLYSWNSEASQWVFVGGLGGSFSGDFTGTFTGSFIGDVTGNVSGNAGTVTNGVYTIGDQSISGNKTFSNAIILETSGTLTTHAVRADRTISAGDGLTGGGDLTNNLTLGVDNTVVRISGNQTIGGTITFSGSVVLSSAGTLTTHAVRADRTISAGDGLTGGGDLTSNLTIGVDNTVVRTARTISAGDGLTGGGNLTSNLTLGVDNTVVRTARTISAGDGLTGGGNLTSNLTLGVDNTVVRISGTQTIGGTKTFSSAIIAGGSITNTPVNGFTVGGNSVGQRFVSTSLPSGGNDGDIWYQY